MSPRRPVVVYESRFAGHSTAPVPRAASIGCRDHMLSRCRHAGAPGGGSRPGVTLVLMALAVTNCGSSSSDRAATRGAAVDPGDTADHHARSQLAHRDPRRRVAPARTRSPRLPHADRWDPAAGRRPHPPVARRSVGRHAVAADRPPPVAPRRESHRRSRVRRVRPPAVRGSGRRGRDVHRSHECTAAQCSHAPRRLG